ncbi:MAG: hypothetical protein ABL982_26730, partial [Vicinamibacterales bacterium]
ARTVIAIDIDDSYGPTDADIRVALSRRTELDTLTIVATLIAGSTAPSQPDDWPMAAVIASHLRSGAYVAVVADGEPSDPQAAPRMRGLLDLAHALNVNGRGALCLLRGSGNRTGAESVMTRHTGYPNAVDFASGVPRYLPHVDTAAEPFDALLVVGRMTDTTGCDAALQPSTVVIGPHATTGPLGNARVVIDTAVAGIHSGGTAVRMDDVPIGLTRVVTGPPDATDICRDLLDQLRSRSR